MNKEAFIKHDEGKPRMDLIPARALLIVGDVMGYGARKYNENNWRLGTAPRYVAAGLRHVMKHLAGERLDEESGLPHLAHAATSFLMALEIDEEC